MMSLKSGLCALGVATVVLLLCSACEGQEAGVPQVSELGAMLSDAAAGLNKVSDEQLADTEERNGSVVRGMRQLLRVFTSYQDSCSQWSEEYNTRQVFLEEAVPALTRILSAYSESISSIDDTSVAGMVLMALSLAPTEEAECEDAISGIEELAKDVQKVLGDAMADTVALMIHSFEWEKEAGIEREGERDTGDQTDLAQTWGCNLIHKAVMFNEDNAEKLLGIRRGWAIVNHIAEGRNLCSRAQRHVIQLLGLQKTVTELHGAIVDGETSVPDILAIIKENAGDADYINQKFARDWTALIGAVTHENPIPILMALLQVEGVDIDATRLDGWSALDVALDGDMIDPIRLLLRRGASTVSIEMAEHYNNNVCSALGFPPCVIDEELDRCVLDWSKPEGHDDQEEEKKDLAAHLHDEL